ncbi:MAG: type III pantothenate kinase [Victivallaceae bacterium]|nr:type III pantothenate kinase [Victivallaceae bacterium]
MVILLNIGNTHTTIAEAENGEINSVRKILTADLNGEILPQNMPVAMATVVPGFRECFAGAGVFRLEPGCVCNINLGKVDSSTLGADRLANLIALEDKFPLPALCIDFGTAVTFEMLDKDANYIGGAIAPGRDLLRRSMHDYTAQLPLVPLENSAPDVPGTTTGKQMQLGINAGVLGAVKKLINVMRRNTDGDLKIVGTGGDAEFFIRNIPGIEYAGDNFTLYGILKAWETHNKCK